MGPDHNLPNTLRELYFHSLAIIVGLLLFAAVIGEIASLMSHEEGAETSEWSELDGF